MIYPMHYSKITMKAFLAHNSNLAIYVGLMQIKSN